MVRHLVFVYGTLKRGCGNHYVMESAGGIFVKEARTGLQGFKMVNLGYGFPALLKTKEQGTDIKGEIFSVDDRGLSVLDALERYPDFYNRGEFMVFSDTNTSYKCVIYYMEEGNHFDIGCNEVKSGEWGPYGPVAYKQEDTVCMAGYEDADFTEKEDDEDADVEDVFNVEPGIYITTDTAEYFGPFDSITEAIDAIPDLADYLGFDVKTLTVGMRLYRDSLSDDDLAEIDNLTLTP